MCCNRHIYDSSARSDAERAYSVLLDCRDDILEDIGILEDMIEEKQEQLDAILDSLDAVENILQSIDE